MSLFPKLKNIHMQISIDLCLEYSFFKSQQNCSDWSIFYNRKEREVTENMRATIYWIPLSYMYNQHWWFNNHRNSPDFAYSVYFCFNKRKHIHVSHFAPSQQPAPLSLKAPGSLRLRTKSLNIGAPSKHLGLVREYFTQELRIFYQAITMTGWRRTGSCGVQTETTLL